MDLLWLYILLGVLGLLIIVAVLYFNRFVKRRLRVENNFSQIKIQCKKRFDLVPNLVETVKGYATHEKSTLENVIAARNTGLSANNPQELATANNQLTQTLGKLFALGEAYPDLKANTGFLSLQGELANIERTIAVARQVYNDSVMIYNKAIMMFPSNIFAAIFRFKKADFFEATEEETQAVKVSF